MRTLWTTERRHVFHTMRDAGYTYREIANALDLHYDQVKTYANKVNRLSNRSHAPTAKHSAQICWMCKWATGAKRPDGSKCSWADRLKPVKGWTAECVPYVNYHGAVQNTSTTWDVQECPEYEYG